VFFENPETVSDLVCEEDEYKGWHGETQRVKDKEFRYCSGAVKSYSHDLAKKISNHDCAQAILDLMDAEFTPSEDCVTSYIAGLEGRVTNMNRKYYWDIRQSNGECVVLVRRNV
jgi:hypothetical protein